MALDNALKEMVEPYHLFEPHPDLQKALYTVIEYIIFAQIMIEEFWKTCWGEPPEEWITHHTPDEYKK